MIRTGLDIFVDTPSVSGKVGLLSTVASQTRTGQTALSALQAAGVDITAIFAPEHGFFGLGAAGEHIPDSAEGSLPIYSLHGDHFAPPPETLRNLDAVIVDLQDVGNRWYTYTYTLRAMLKTCAGVGVPVIVLDRPNPQGGITVEGNLAEHDYFSIVAPGAIPARHALTIGELARWFNLQISGDLFVIAMDGWRREMLWNETGLRWYAPSPGIPHPHSAFLYTGTCLIEGTTLSEGRGTALPFEQIGAPYVRAEELAYEMNGLELPGVYFSPAWFMPTHHKHQGERCEGVRIQITDLYPIRGFALGISLIQTLYRLYPDDFQWRVINDQHFFDKLTGTHFVRAMIESGQPTEDILALCDEQSAEFQAQSAGVWLYGE